MALDIKTWRQRAGYRKWAAAADNRRGMASKAARWRKIRHGGGDQHQAQHVSWHQLARENETRASWHGENGENGMAYGGRNQRLAKRRAAEGEISWRRALLYRAKWHGVVGMALAGGISFWLKHLLSL
jgi:hypothetical protein